MATNKMASPPIDAAREDQAFAAEVEAVNRWWGDSRWRYTKRPFTAEQIVAKRGTLKIEYASNAMSKKLWKILEGRFNVCNPFPLKIRGRGLIQLLQNGDASYTYGCLEPTMLTQMAKYLDTVYISGWQSSSTASASDEPGPDLADYPMTTVPNKVQHLFMAQLFHDRKQREERLTKPKAQRAQVANTDFL